MHIHKGSFFNIDFREGVFRISLTKEVTGTPEEAWEWINCMQDMLDQLERPFPLLSVVKHKVHFTSESRRIMRMAEDVEQFVAHAMVAKSLAIKAMIKVLSVMVPRNLYDSDVFMKEENCINWLKDQIEKSSHAPIKEEEAKALKIEIKTSPRLLTEEV